MQWRGVPRWRLSCCPLTRFVWSLKSSQFDAFAGENKNTGVQGHFLGATLIQRKPMLWARKIMGCPSNPVFFSGKKQLRRVEVYEKWDRQRKRPHQKQAEIYQFQSLSCWQSPKFILLRIYVVTNWFYSKRKHVSPKGRYHILLKAAVSTPMQPGHLRSFLLSNVQV